MLFESPWAWGWSAIAAIAGAIAAIAIAATALYAWRQIEDNRKFSKRRLTVDLFDSETSKTFTQTVNDIRLANGSLTNCRTYVITGWGANPVTPVLQKQTNEVLGTLGYAGVLYCEDALDKEIFLARARDFIASAFYMFEPLVATHMRAGVLDRSVVTMVQDCLEYRRNLPRKFDPSPELHTYNVPADFPGP